MALRHLVRENDLREEGLQKRERTRFIRDGAFILKLSALIDQLVAGLVDTVAGTGGKRRHCETAETNLMSQQYESSQLTITSPDGWIFAYEGGAHILFRNTSSDRRFV